MSANNLGTLPSVTKLNGTTKPALMDNNNINQHHQSVCRNDTSIVGGGGGGVGDEVKVYFKQSEYYNNKFRCLLCSVELHGDSNSRLFLAEHLRLKHEIEREKDARNQVARSQLQQQNSNNIKKISISKSSQEMKAHEASANMTNHKHQRFKPNDDRRSMNNSKSNHNSGDLRRNLDLLDYADLSKASLKPLPSASLSRNLFSRINQLSEPVARKLKFWNKKSFQVNSYDPCFKVIYLGNLGMQYWSKDESCLERPLNTLWNNYLVNMKTEIVMRLTICNSGLKAITRQHGLTQYWSNRLVYCCSLKEYPKVFSWIYRHEGKKMRQELRCHAVFCSSPERAAKMVTLLNQRLACALQEFRREKKSRGVPSIVGSDGMTPSKNSTLTQQTIPRTIPLRRQILAKGAANFRPPLERSKSAPKLMSIREEDYELEEEDEEEEEEEEEEEDEVERYARDDISHDEFEYEQSFGERDDDEDDDEQADSEYDELGEGKHDDDDDEDSAHRADSNSLTTTGNEETSNSSVYAAGDISYDNIIMNKQHLATNQERLDCASTLTAPAATTGTSFSSFRRSTSIRKSTRMNQLHAESMLKSKPDENPPSPDNSIEVDMSRFEVDTEDDESNEQSHTTASCHNLNTSANTILQQQNQQQQQQQESTSSSNRSCRSSIKINVERTGVADQQSRSSSQISVRPSEIQETSPETSNNLIHISTNLTQQQQQQHEKKHPNEYAREHSRLHKITVTTTHTGQQLKTSEKERSESENQHDGDSNARDIILSWSNKLTIE